MGLIAGDYSTTGNPNNRRRPGFSALSEIRSTRPGGELEELLARILNQGGSQGAQAPRQYEQAPEAYQFSASRGQSPAAPAPQPAVSPAMPAPAPDAFAPQAPMSPASNAPEDYSVPIQRHTQATPPPEPVIPGMGSDSAPSEELLRRTGYANDPDSFLDRLLSPFSPTGGLFPPREGQTELLRPEEFKPPLSGKKPSGKKKAAAAKSDPVKEFLKKVWDAPDPVIRKYNSPSKLWNIGQSQIGKVNSPGKIWDISQREIEKYNSPSKLLKMLGL